MNLPLARRHCSTRRPSEYWSDVGSPPRGDHGSSRDAARPGPPEPGLLRGHGRRGACWFAERSGAARFQAAFPVAVLDSTGCGDVFHGAYAAAIARGEPRPYAIETASAAVAIKATRPGGRAGIPSRK
jgi:sugar/nucleoside kinase (ribokinase family)